MKTFCCCHDVVAEVEVECMGDNQWKIVQDIEVKCSEECGSTITQYARKDGFCYQAFDGSSGDFWEAAKLCKDKRGTLITEPHSWKWFTELRKDLEISDGTRWWTGMQFTYDDDVLHAVL